MTKQFNISVIIPVYNAAEHLREAVESVLIQPEVNEIMLVEDGSTDNSLHVCQQLEAELDIVRCLQHPNNDNKGAGPTRNLGILNAKNELIAFLDADDYFVPNRFKQAISIIKQDPTIDGVYEAIGFAFENEEAIREWQIRAPEYLQRGLIGPEVSVPPDALFDALINGNNYFHGNGLTVHKPALLKVGLYTDIRTSQDAVLCYQLASKCRLVAGDLDNPVSYYRLGSNRTSLIYRRNLNKANDSMAVNISQTFWYWTLTNHDLVIQQRSFRRYNQAILKRYKDNGLWKRMLIHTKHYTTAIGRSPKLIITPYFWQELVHPIIKRLKT